MQYLMPNFQCYSKLKMNVVIYISYMHVCTFIVNLELDINTFYFNSNQNYFIIVLDAL